MFSSILWAVVSLAAARRLQPDVDTRNAAPSFYLFLFGDSYTMTGFNISHQPQPSPDNPFGNPDFPGDRLSGGEIWADVVLNEHVPPGTVAYDFAAGGNPVNADIVNSTNGALPPIVDFRAQQREFEVLDGARTLSWNATNSLFISWFGVNDITFQFYAGRDYDESEAILRPDVEDYYHTLDQQYRLGARNFITILVPPLFRAPVFGYGDPPNENVQNVTTLWNRRICEEHNYFRRMHHLAWSVIVDPTETFDHILDSPELYGAPNSSCVNYPEGQPCLWHDFIHPGIAIQRDVGRQIGEVVADMISWL